MGFFLGMCPPGETMILLEAQAGRPGQGSVVPVWRILIETVLARRQYYHAGVRDKYNHA